MKKHTTLALFALIVLCSFMASSAINVGQLKVTLEHPFLIDNEWLPANQLKEGDQLTTINGKKAIITSIQKVHVPEGIKVYNLEDDFGINNYVVDGVVVHNSNYDVTNTMGGYKIDDPRLDYRLNPKVVRTIENRLIASQDAIKSIIEPGGKVVEVGIGGEDAPTFRELIDALGPGTDVNAIELNTQIIPPDISGRVIPGNILDLNAFPVARQAIAEADVIRISNLAFQWFSPEQRATMLAGLKENMKDGAKLLLTHREAATSGMGFIPIAEEGFLYIKSPDQLKAVSYLFEVEADEGKGILAGDYFPDSTTKKWAFEDKYMWEAIYKDECLFQKLRAHVLTPSRDMYFGGYVGGMKPRFLKEQQMLSIEIRDAIVRHMQSLGYDAQMMGDIMIQVPIQDGPPEIIISEGLESQ